MIFSSQIDGTSVTKGKTLEEEYKDSTTENCVLGPREPSKKFVTCSKNNEFLLFEMFLDPLEISDQLTGGKTSFTNPSHALSARIKIVKHNPAAINGLAVKKLFH